MPELPVRKVGLLSCSGEEMREGTISRLATRQGTGIDATRTARNHLSSLVSRRRGRGSRFCPFLPDDCY